MTKQIEAETLREWLDAQQPVTVLDIRTDEDHAQWAIPEAARQRARALFASLIRLQNLQSKTVVLPAHASEPIAFDGRAVAAEMGAIAAWLSGWLVSESAFVERVTSQLPPTPPNFVRIVDLNETGEFPTSDPTDLEAGANRCAVR